MAVEIERKFLVKDASYRNLAFRHYEIRQGYIANEDGRSVRVRITDNEAVLTIKGPSDSRGMSRYEWSQLISVEDALELFKLHRNGCIEKRRYLVHSGPHVFEVDEFYGDNEGLVIAEVELNSEDEVFEKPDFIGKEVTGDDRYYNVNLAVNPFKNWEKG
ncbi:MAG TPA: adenylate cyclase [Bacteroidales bacterium]|jgi:adenylate cyclase|nr:CYTH domain-containing protein [Bacteroidales bacterium]HBA12755.1 adenylate cyclase [Bacteroidales bacterium]